MSEHQPPRIESGIPDQDGTPGFYLYLPGVAYERFTELLQQAVPEHALAWSAYPPAWWVAEEYRAPVRTLATAFYGYLQEEDQGETVHTFWRGDEVA